MGLILIFTSVPIPGIGVASESEDVSKPEIQRDPRLYFEDGSVVLQAVDKADATRDTLFRVHIGVLSKHSSVFAGMFPPPDGQQQKENKTTDINETYEDMPLVRMPDPSEQVEALLYVFYDPLSVHCFVHALHPLTAIAGI